jgi:hypothetical protein
MSHIKKINNLEALHTYIQSDARPDWFLVFGKNPSQY